jgi:hypothetical protein
MTRMSSRTPVRDRGRVERAPLADRAPAGAHLGSRRDGLADVRVDDRALVVVDQRTHLGRGVQARADSELLGPLGQGGDERLGDRLVDVDALDRRADLPGIGERADGRLLGGPLGVDVAVDDQRVLAAELEQHLLRSPGGGLRDRLTRPGRAGVHDQVDAGVGDQRGAGAAVAEQQVERAGRQLDGDRLDAEDGPTAASSPTA